MRVMGVDPGRSTGICHGEPGSTPVYSLLRLPDVDDYGVRLNVLEDGLRRFIVGDAITHLYFEEAFINVKAPNRNQIALLFGYRAAILKACAREGIEAVGITAAAWRSTMLDGAKPPQGMDTARRRQWLKQQAIKRCVRKGWIITSDDVAEACCIWEHGCGVLDVNSAIDSTPLFGRIML